MQSFIRTIRSFISKLFNRYREWRRVRQVNYDNEILTIGQSKVTMYVKGRLPCVFFTAGRELRNGQIELASKRARRLLRNEFSDGLVEYKNVLINTALIKEAHIEDNDALTVTRKFYREKILHLEVVQ